MFGEGNGERKGKKNLKNEESREGVRDIIKRKKMKLGERRGGGGGKKQGNGTKLK